MQPRKPEHFEKPAAVYLTTSLPMALMYGIRNFEYSYGYTREGQICYDEYFPDALQFLYGGKSASLYLCAPEDTRCTKIPNEVLSANPVPVLQEIEIPDVFEALLEQGATSLIFDVRYNPGGYAHELVALLDYLLPKGDLFIGEDYLGNRSVDTSDADCLDIPMAVLVNGDSFSAAEFFAAALRDYEWATVIGEQTVGKGYFQQSFKLSDGSAVNLSVGKYYTPAGISLAEVGGLTPDTVVEVDDEMYLDIYYGNVPVEEDPQIQAAVKALKGE